MATENGPTTSGGAAVDLDQALLDPSSVFKTPADVVAHPELSGEQKIEILRRWEYDESEIAVAEEEGMPDGRPLMLDQIIRALEALGADIDKDHRPPTKQGGI